MDTISLGGTVSSSFGRGHENVFVSKIKSCILLGGIIERFCYMRVQTCVKGSLWKASRQRVRLCQWSVYCPSNPNSSFIIRYAKVKLVHLNIFLSQLVPCWILSVEGNGESLQEKGGSLVWCVPSGRQAPARWLLLQHLQCRQLPRYQILAAGSCSTQHPRTSAWPLSLAAFSGSYIVECLQWDTSLWTVFLEP